jgi:dipeptidyl aminopeptidase/acylaminoacyl peptidase
MRDRSVGLRVEVAALLGLEELSAECEGRPVPPEATEHIGGARRLVPSAVRKEVWTVLCEVEPVPPSGTALYRSTVLQSDVRHAWGCPAWSADGSSIALVSGAHELLIVRPDGTSFSLATGAPTSSSAREAGYVEGFAWSPDGAGLAVLDSGEVWLVPVDGRDPEAVWTPGDRQLASAIAWEPDGRRLAVSGRFGPRNRCCDGSVPFLELVQMRDGSRASVPIQGDADAQIHWRRVRAKILAHLGEHEDALVLATQAAELARRTDDLDRTGRAVLDLAEVLRLAGRADEAAAAAREAAETFERKGNVMLAAAAARYT